MSHLDSGQTCSDLEHIFALGHKLTKKFYCALIESQAFESLVVNITRFLRLSMLDALSALVY